MLRKGGKGGRLRGIRLWGGRLARALGWRGTVVFWRWVDVCGRVEEGLGCVVRV